MKYFRYVNKMCNASFSARLKLGRRTINKSHASPGNKYDGEQVRYADKTRFDRYYNRPELAKLLYWCRKNPNYRNIRDY